MPVPAHQMVMCSVSQMAASLLSLDFKGCHTPNYATWLLEAPTEPSITTKIWKWVKYALGYSGPQHLFLT